MRIRNPLLLRLSYVDLVPGALGGGLLAMASGDSLRNAKYQHMGHAVTPQAAEPDLPLRGPKDATTDMAWPNAAARRPSIWTPTAGTKPIAASFGPSWRSTPPCSWSRSAPAWRLDRPRCRPMLSISLATPRTTPSACLWLVLRCAIAPWPRWSKARPWVCLDCG